MKSKNLGDLFKKFIENGKKYVEYLMKVDFRELFINVLILICILVLSVFAYIPVGIIGGIIKGLITIFPVFTPVTLMLYEWAFGVVGVFISIIAFMYMFNMRFDDIEELKKQINAKPKTEENKKDNSDSNDDIELPKAKKNK